jgi:hypothetical protein
MEDIACSAWAPAASDALERESRLVTEAIAMVASGAAPRVVVASLRQSQALLDPSRQRALEAGVRIRALWRNDGAGADLAVEPIDE